MLIKKAAPLSTPLKKDFRLFSKASELLTSDLSNPKVQTSARKVLSKIREKGYPLLEFEAEEPDCLSCLTLALQNACDLMWRTRHLH